MNTVSIFNNEIDELQASIAAFQSRLALLQKAETSATELLSAIAQTKAQFEELGACAKLRQAVLDLFGGTLDPTPEDKKVIQPGDNSDQPNFQDFVTEVPPKQLTIESAIADSDDTRWNPEQFDLHPVEMDGQAIIPGLEPGDPDEPSDPEEELEQPVAVSTVEVAAEAEQVNYSELVQLTPTLAYYRKYDGEIQAAYLGTTTQKLAKEWAEQIELWGCRTQVRKAKRVTSEGVAWEIKIWNVSSDRLTKLATYHSQPFQTVAAASSVGKEPKKSSAPIGDTTSSGSCETQNAATNEKPSVQQNDSQLKVGDRVRIAEMIGEYRLCSINGKHATARRTDDGMLVTGVALADCTPVLVDEPEIQFAFRQVGDSISADFEVFLGTERIGKVWEHLTVKGWNHSQNRNSSLSWPTREDAALALHASYEANRQTHQSTTDALRAKYGLAG